MIELIYGGSGSGKSEFAEDEIIRISESFSAFKKPRFLPLQENNSPSQAARDNFDNKSHCNLFYVATMKVCDDESRRRVERHKKLRGGKNFITIEASENIGRAGEIIKNYCDAELDSASEFRGARFESCVLLECLSNLVANEMFLGSGEILESQKVVHKIENGLEKLFSDVNNVVIVSNNIFDDGIEYDETTREYQKTLAELNAFIAKKAEKVSEIVAGIEIKIK